MTSCGRLFSELASRLANLLAVFDELSSPMTIHLKFESGSSNQA